MEEYKNNNKKGLIPKNEKINLSEWYKIWLFDFKENEVKASTTQRYDVIYRNYIENSEIGGIKLKDLNTRTIQNYYNNLTKSGKTPMTIKILNKALKSCLEHARKVENYNRLEFILTLGTGLRIGELVALRWKDIDFEKGNLKVNKSIGRGYVTVDGERKYVIQETTPKTSSSIREVPIPNVILEEIKAYKEKQDDLKEKYREVYNDKDYVFSNVIGEGILSDTLSKSFVKALKDNGIRHVKFHLLRHTYATRLFEKWVPLKMVQKLLGHSSIQITADIYTHVMASEKISAVQKLNDLFEE